jgi:23S rRNA-/tRNA-specific pseudouridylate synthase
VGQRLDRYLKATAIGWISAQKYLRAHDLAVLRADGQTTTENSYRIQEGDRLMVRRGREISAQLLGRKNPEYVQMDEGKVEEKLRRMIIFDNHNITILNKLPGYSVQGDADPHHNLFSLMASKYKKDMIYISHRLDKPTTGLVLVSKNLATAQLLGEALESRSGIEKFYLALTEGREVGEKRGTIANQVEWTSKHKARITEYEGKDQNSQLAVTNYLVLKEKPISDILWRNFIGMKLVTGRKHQIRCHLSQALLNPIMNDDLYFGRRVSDIGPAIFLHSFALKITSKPLLEKVFKFEPGSGPILDNEKGCIKMVGGELFIYGKLPPIW